MFDVHTGTESLLIALTSRKEKKNKPAYDFVFFSWEAINRSSGKTHLIENDGFFGFLPQTFPLRLEAIIKSNQSLCL